MCAAAVTDSARIAAAGLSPRVRGNHRGRRLRGLAPGSIPACAGEPVPPGPPWTRRRVYPRVCGGTSGSTPNASLTRGLSPRVRGNLMSTRHRHHFGRSIPACAGEPNYRQVRVTAAGVYPRVCGGTPRTLRSPRFARGLSPRVRGNLRPDDRQDGRRGSIPACAGEPGTIPGDGCVMRVYPRVCGGTSDTDQVSGIAWGLSPRVRGNLLKLVSGHPASGSIPACAGEPSCPWRCICRGRVYPRVCGGTDEEQTAYQDGEGLSPRVRGNHTVLNINAIMGGSIPACAGEPRLWCGSLPSSWVYPRVCGGTSMRVPFGSK